MRPELRVPVFFMPIRGCGTLFGAERLFEQDHVAQQDALLDDRVVVIAGKKVVDAACGAEAALIIRKSKCSTDFKRNDFLKKNEAYPLGALRSLKFAYRKLRISLFVELAV